MRPLSSRSSGSSSEPCDNVTLRLGASTYQVSRLKLFSQIDLSHPRWLGALRDMEEYDVKSAVNLATLKSFIEYALADADQSCVISIAPDNCHDFGLLASEFNMRNVSENIEKYRG
jgi:hypothetical protein